MAGIKFQASPTIARFLRSNAPSRLLVGPVGSGKSSACCLEILRRATEMPPGPDGIRRSRVAVIRNTYPELRDTTIRTFREWIPEYLGSWRSSEHLFELRAKGIECDVLFRALDTPQDVKKLLSLELSFAYINEAREIPRPVFDMLPARLGRYPRIDAVGPYWHGFWGDTNPPDVDHYLYRIYEEERPDGYEVFKQPGGRSPEAENLEHLPRCWAPSPLSGPEERAELALRRAAGEHEPHCVCYYRRIMAGKRQDWIRVNVDGEYGFVVDGKPIYPEYQDTLHCAEMPPPPTGALVTIGNDYGLTPAAVWVYEDPKDGQIQVHQEYVSQSMGAITFGKQMRQICTAEFRGARFQGFGDPAGVQRSQVDERTPIDVINGCGIPMEPAGTNDFMLRREAVATSMMTLTMLGRPGLVIHPRCTVLRKAMTGGYCLRRIQRSGADSYHDAPDKNEFSHVAEALQYALVGLGRDARALTGGGARSSSKICTSSMA